MNGPLFTPGPWEARVGVGAGSHLAAPPHIAYRYQDEQGRRCTSFLAEVNSATQPNEANCRLMAAAPDLYGVVSEMLDLRIGHRPGIAGRHTLWSLQIDDRAFRRWDALLAKARGE